MIEIELRPETLAALDYIGERFRLASAQVTEAEIAALAQTVAESLRRAELTPHHRAGRLIETSSDGPAALSD